MDVGGGWMGRDWAISIDVAGAVGWVGGAWADIVAGCCCDISDTVIDVGGGRCG